MNDFKNKIISDIQQLISVSKHSNYKLKKYSSWIDLINKNKISSDPQLIKFLESKASFIGNNNKDYADYLFKISSE